MEYEAKDLADIAEMFSDMAIRLNLSASKLPTKTARENLEGKAAVWSEAAEILRNTRIVP